MPVSLMTDNSDDTGVDDGTGNAIGDNTYDREREMKDA